MKQSDIDRIKELDSNATPGTWTWINSNMSINRFGRLFANSDLVLDADLGAFGSNIHDAKLIAEYRTLCPALLAEYEALKRANSNQINALIECNNELIRSDEKTATAYEKLDAEITVRNILSEQCTALIAELEVANKKLEKYQAVAAAMDRLFQALEQLKEGE